MYEMNLEMEKVNISELQQGVICSCDAIINHALTIAALLSFSLPAIAILLLIAADKIF